MSKRRENALAHLLKHGSSRVGANIGIDLATAVTLCEDGVAEFAPDGKGGQELRLVKGTCIHGCPPENECRFCISEVEEKDFRREPV
jgi:hypothetical protein